MELIRSVRANSLCHRQYNEFRNFLAIIGSVRFERSLIAMPNTDALAALSP